MGRSFPHILFTVVLAKLAWASTAPAAEQACDPTEPLISVTTVGAKKTKAYVIRRYFPLSEGDLPSEDSLQTGIEDLKNTRLFTKVEAVCDRTDLGQTLTLFLEEAHTLVPILLPEANATGFRITTGLFEGNLVGLGMKTYFVHIYNSIGGTHSGQVFLDAPRIGGSPLRLISLVSQMNILEEFRANSGVKDPVAGWMRRQSLMRLEARYRQNSWLEWSLIGGAQRAAFRQDGEFLGAEIRQASLQNGVERPLDYTFPFLGLAANLGQVAIDRFNAQGCAARLEVERALPAPEPETLSGQAGRFRWRCFHTVSPTMVLVQQFRYDAVDSRHPGRYRSLRNNQQLRGVLDGTHVGRQLWQLNHEARLDLFENKYVLFRGVAFTDVGQTIDPLPSLQAQLEDSGKLAWTAGGGLRVYWPKLPMAGLNIDVGRQIKPTPAVNFRVALNEMIRF